MTNIGDVIDDDAKDMLILSYITVVICIIPWATGWFAHCSLFSTLIYIIGVINDDDDDAKDDDKGC